MPNNIYGRSNGGVQASITALSGLVSGAQQILDGASAVKGIVKIVFPSMPDTVDLVRRAHYYSMPTFTMPDGFWQYQYTEPLKIPLSFELHAFDDDYCQGRGGYALLDIAAKLHSLVLPIQDSGSEVLTTSNGLTTTSNNKAETPTGWFSSKSSTADQNLAARAAQSQQVTVADNLNSTTAFPVACYLDLISAGLDAPGVSAVGFVEDVAVSLGGPWLRPPFDLGKNIPIVLKARFTFVHRPSHTNLFTGGTGGGTDKVQLNNVNAYADDVKNRLYNTVSLIKRASYRGFST